MTDSTFDTQHPDSPVPTTSDGLLVRLSGETVELVRKARSVAQAASGTSGGDTVFVDIILETLDAVQKDIESANTIPDYNDRRCPGCGNRGINNCLRCTPPNHDHGAV